MNVTNKNVYIMDCKLIQNRIINIENTIIQALKKMDDEKVKLLFVFHLRKFVGIFTLGDVQRAIIANISLDRPISEIIDINKKYASIDDSAEEIKEKMVAIRAECMPIVDHTGELVHVYFWEDFFGATSFAAHREKLDVPVIIMAGGMGTRLQPLTNIIPKPLIPIGNKSILEIILDKFCEIGCKKFFLSVNYKAEMLQFYLETLPKFYDIEYFKEEKPLGTIGSVSLIKDKINAPFFVSNCDILIDQDFRDVYEYHIENANEITIVAALKQYNIPYGVVESGENGILTDIKEKPSMTYLINTGVYVLNANIINEIPMNEFFHITNLIDKVRDRGGKVGCFPVSENSWKDIGEWTEYLRVMNIK